MIESVLILDANTKVVLNRVSIDSDRPETFNLLPGQLLSPRHDGDIGWTLTPDNEWINPNPPTPYPMDVKIRFIRDKLLDQSDMYMISDYPISDSLREQWRQYRQQLRDVPQQQGFPDNVIWPTKPS